MDFFDEIIGTRVFAQVYVLTASDDEIESTSSFTGFVRPIKAMIKNETREIKGKISSHIDKVREEVANLNSLMVKSNKELKQSIIQEITEGNGTSSQKKISVRDENGNVKSANANDD